MLHLIFPLEILTLGTSYDTFCGWHFFSHIVIHIYHVPECLMGVCDAQFTLFYLPDLLVFTIPSTKYLGMFISI